MDNDPLAHVPSAPRQPSPAARELIFRYQGTRRMLFITGLIILLTGLPLLAIFCSELPADLILLISPLHTEGRVVSVVVHRQKRGSSAEIHFRYTNDDGIEREAASYTHDPALRAQAVPGATVPVEIRGPWARIAGCTRSLFGYIGVTVLINPIAGLILLMWAVRGRRRAIFAFINGRPILARVTFAGENKHVHSGKRYPFVVKWEFTVAGARYRGSVSSMDREMMKELLDKEEIVVLYDAMNPSINTAFIS